MPTLAAAEGCQQLFSGEIASRINGLQQPLENCSRLIHKLLIRLNFEIERKFRGVERA
jgi:hypothetical protein